MGRNAASLRHDEFLARAGAGALGKVLHTELHVGGCRVCPQVIFDEEHQAEILHRSEVQSLISDACRLAAIPDVSHHRNVAPLQARAQSYAGKSFRLLSDGMQSFDRFCVSGLTANSARIAELLSRSLMLVTALAPHIGYDKAAAIAKKAHAEHSSLREAALQLGFVSGEDFDRWVRPEDMLGPA